MKWIGSYKNIMEKLHAVDSLGTPIESYNEIAFFIDFLVTYKGTKCCTLKFKMKADNYTVNELDKKLILNDLKTTGHPVVSKLRALRIGSIVAFTAAPELLIFAATA